MADHRAQEAKGRVKEAAGSLTNRGDLVRKGQDDRSKANVKKAAGDVKNRARKTAIKAKDKLSGAADRGKRRT
jgi:uncharacterized protein YjbJ (UPF0337 family)